MIVVHLRDGRRLEVEMDGEAAAFGRDEKGGFYVKRRVDSTTQITVAYVSRALFGFSVVDNEVKVVGGPASSRD